MGRNKQPIELVIANGKKHLTKDDMRAPSYLTAKQKKQFNEIASKLIKLKIMGETDVDALARYIISNDLYLNAVKQLRKKEVQKDVDTLSKWSNLQDKFFKQCRTCASDLGLTISSRCKLVIPEINKEAPNKNKFNIFE